MTLATCPSDDCAVVLFDGACCPSCSTPGVFDGEREWAVAVSHPRRTEPLHLNCRSEGSAETTAAHINGDGTGAAAVVVSRPHVGWAES